MANSTVMVILTGRILDFSNADQAVDQYHRFKVQISRIKQASMSKLNFYSSQYSIPFFILITTNQILNEFSIVDSV